MRNYNCDEYKSIGICDCITEIISIINIERENELPCSEKITIFCHYSDCNYDLICEGYYLFVELFNKEQALLKKFINFTDKSEMIAFAVLIYDTYKENFGEVGFNFTDDTIGKSFASGSSNFDLEKGTGINYVCHGIDYREFTKNSKDNIQYKKCMDR